MPHKFVIEQNKAGEYVAKFKHNGETIFWTEGYTRKDAARNAIASVLKNGPGAPVEET
ncbi:YegP family protein [uncultured Sphingomonas sp.]|uniref:YegP family protein n=1 Tax=uncultured Sphingomonas sp. TaxID=158754 RepID=UPI0035C9FBC2